ncbi:MAG: NAD(P)H-binding protein [Deltaproteobacteria bacterium]
MKIAILGCTGETGRLVLERALDRGHDLVALARTPSKLDVQHEHLEVKAADVTDVASLEAGFAGVDAVVSCVGSTTTRPPITLYSEGTSAIVRAMDKQGVKRLVVLSSGALTIGRDPNYPLFFEWVIKPLMLKHVYADMRKMEAIVTGSNLDWTLIRPSRLTSDPGKAPLRSERDKFSLSDGFWTARDRLAEEILDKVEDDDAKRAAFAVAN